MHFHRNLSTSNTYIYIYKCSRNKALESNGAKPPKATSTGTTIVGVVFKVRDRYKGFG